MASGSRCRAPGAGCEKQEALNQLDRVGLLSTGIAGLIRADEALSVGVLKVRTGCVVAVETKTGNPEVAFSITVSSQPPASALATPFQLLPQFLAFAKRQIVNHAGREIVIQVNLRESPVQILPVRQREVGGADDASQAVA